MNVLPVSVPMLKLRPESSADEPIDTRRANVSRRRAQSGVIIVEVDPEECTIVAETQLKEPLVGFEEYDLNHVVADRAAIDEVNPHRFELALLDAVVFIDDQRAVAYRDVRDDDFWARGHFPELPLMPGVLVAETAAQLTCFFAGHQGLRGDGLLGLGGLDECRFRAPVRPGDRLVVQIRVKRTRPNVMIVTEFHAYVERTLCAEGIIKGTVLPKAFE